APAVDSQTCLARSGLVAYGQWILIRSGELIAGVRDAPRAAPGRGLHYLHSAPCLQLKDASCGPVPDSSGEEGKVHARQSQVAIGRPAGRNASIVHDGESMRIGTGQVLITRFCQNVCEFSFTTSNRRPPP